MIKKEHNYSSITSLLISIVFLIIGALLFNNPGEVITTISKLFGGILSIVGLFKIILHIRKKNKGIQTTNLNIASGIGILVVGLLFIFLAGAFETALRFIIGAWILISGVNKLIAIISIGSQNNNFASMIIISIILIFIGGYIILVSNLVVQVIGLIIMIYSAIEIISYIIYKVSDIKPSEKEDKEDTKEITHSKDAKDAKYEEKK